MANSVAMAGRPKNAAQKSKTKVTRVPIHLAGKRDATGVVLVLVIESVLEGILRN
jgi:hypothetical protein